MSELRVSVSKISQKAPANEVDEPKADKFHRIRVTNKLSRGLFIQLPQFPHSWEPTKQLTANEKAILEVLNDRRIKLIKTGRKKSIYNISNLQNYVLVSCSDSAHCDKGALCYLQFVGLETAYVQHRFGPLYYVAHRCKEMPFVWIVKRQKLPFKPYSTPVVEIIRKIGAEKEQAIRNEFFLLTHLPNMSGCRAKVDVFTIIKRQCYLIFHILEKLTLKFNAKLNELRIKFGINHEDRLLLLEVLSDNIFLVAPEKTDQSLVHKKLSENRRLLILNDSDSSSDWAKGAVEFAKEFDIGIEIRDVSICYAYEKFIEIVDENDQGDIPTIFVTYDDGRHILAHSVASRTTCPVISVLNSESHQHNIPSVEKAFTVVANVREAILAAASIFGMNNPVIWARRAVHNYKKFVRCLELDAQCVVENEAKLH